MDGVQGFHFKLSNRSNVVARLARGDVNMYNYDGSPIHTQVPEVKFEVAVYELFRSDPNILVSRLLYHHIPGQHVGPKLGIPGDIAGCRLFLFARAEGENNVWRNLSSEDKVRDYVSHLLPSIQFPCCESFSVDLSSCSGSFHPRITV